MNLVEAAEREGQELRNRVAALGPYWSALDETDPDEVVADLQRPVDVAPTCFGSWNRASRDEGGGKGLARGWLTLAAATTGQGKSILALNLARTWIGAGEQVGYLSLEMSERQLRTRILAMLSGEPVASLEPGSRFDETAFRRALSAARDIHRHAGGRLYTSDEPLYDLTGILAAMEALHYGHGCRAFIVDYLQLAGNPNDPDSITTIAHQVRRKTRELDVATVGLSQFNRLTSANGGRPTVHGLMGGSALENDSDQILIIDHTSKHPSPAPHRGWDGIAVLSKNRHGPTGVEIPIRFDSRTLRMTEVQPDELPSRERDA